MTDRISSPLNNIINALNLTTRSFQGVDNSLANAFDVTPINGMSGAINDLVGGIDILGNEINRVDNSMRDLSGNADVLGNEINQANRNANTLNSGLNRSSNSMRGLTNNASILGNEILQTSRNIRVLNNGIVGSAMSMGALFNSANGLDNIVNQVISSMDSLNDMVNRVTDSMGDLLSNTRQTVGSIDNNIRGIGGGIDSNTTSQNRFNSSLQTGNNYLKNMLSNLKGMVATYVSLQGAKALINMSDTAAQNTARLTNMNTGLGDGEYSTEGLEDLIFNTAQKTGTAYNEMVDLVSRFGNNAGDAFGSSAEVVAFTDLLNKQLVSDGASKFSAESALFQLSQALGAGVLQGEELNSILDATPNLVQHIADYMGVARGEIKGLASEGKITADIVTGAVFDAADVINSTFETMPNTWSQTWTRMKNQSIVALEPVLNKLSEIANSTGFQTFALNVANGMTVVGNALVGVIDLAVQFGSYISENLGSILPQITMIVGAFLLYNIALKAVIVSLAIFKASKMAINALFITSKVIMGAITLATMAYNAINLAMAGGMSLSALAANGLAASLRTLWATMSPILLIAAKIILVIVLIAAVIGFVIYKIIQWGDTTNTVVGNICGVLAVAGAFIGNMFFALINFVSGLFITLWNLIVTFANFFGNVFNNPVQAIANLFSGLFDFILGIVQSVAKAIDTLLGSNLAGAVSGFRNKVKDFTVGLVGEQTVVMEQLNQDDFALSGFDYVEAWNMGASFGDGLSGFASDLFSTNDTDLIGDTPFDYSDYLSDITGGLGDISDVLGDTGGVGGGVSDIAGSTADISDTISVSEEDLKYLRDLVSREAVNRFTTSNITNEILINNNVDKDVDLDGLVNKLTVSMGEAIEKSAEGVH